MHLTEPEINSENYDPEIGADWGETDQEGFDPGSDGTVRENDSDGFDPGMYSTGNEAIPEFSLESKEPGRTAIFCTRVADWQAHLSGRLQKKMAKFDERIAAFRERGWS